MHRRFPYPVFVKPARSGSSFGVSKVTRKEDFPEAFRIALQYDTKVLVEEAVEGREVGCALLGSGEELTVGAVDEISLSHGVFPHPSRAASRTGFAECRGPCARAAFCGRIVTDTGNCQSHLPCFGL